MRGATYALLESEHEKEFVRTLPPAVRVRAQPASANEHVFATIENTHLFNNGGGTFLQYGPGNGPSLTEFECAKNDLGSWTSPDSWNPRIVPNDRVHSALFRGAITRPTTVVTNREANTYNIAGVGSVNVATTATPTVSPTIDVFSGKHQFQAIVNLQDNAAANIASGSTLTFNNELNLMGHTLTKTGAGNLAINNKLTTSGGTVNIQQGAVSGGGTIGGDVNNDGGTISPGDIPGEMTIEGDYTQPEDATLLIELAGTDTGTHHDVLTVEGEVSFDGTLEVSLLDGFQPENGDSFDVFYFGSVSGQFDDVILPDLSAGLAWHISGLMRDGVLAVVPEPAAGLLLGMGLLRTPGAVRKEPPGDAEDAGVSPSRLVPSRRRSQSFRRGVRRAARGR